MLRRPAREEVLGHLPEVEFLISERSGEIDAEMIAAGENLRLIQRVGSLSYDIDLEAARAAGVPVCVWPIRTCILVAEHMVMQMLALAKRLSEVTAIAAEVGGWGPSRRTDEDTFAYNWSNREDIGGIYGQAVGIQMDRPDTNTALESGPTVASRCTILGGNATRAAADNLVQMLDLAAADLLGCQVSQLIRDSEAYVGPDAEPAPWEAVVDHARAMGLSLSVQGKWSTPEIHWDHRAGRGTPYFAYHFGAQIVEVEVDMGTGKTDVVGLWAAHDAGKVIFPQGAYGQLYGGIAQGLGYALTERVDYDEGCIQVTNFDEYLIPTAMDIPDIEAAFVETHLSDGPYGAKNIAEPALVPTAAATLNAIAHATGRRIRDLPASLERVLLGHDLRKPGSSAACKAALLMR